MYFYQLGVLFSESPLNHFHNFNCCLLVAVLVFVLSAYLFLFLNYYTQNLLLGYQKVEVFCCLFPVLILVIQMLPSLILLWKSNFYFISSGLSIKVTGHQWYWSYEVGDFLGLEFDSYMKSSETLTVGELLFLEVDNRLVLPVEVPIRFILTSTDVIHSWALPSFFLKLDAVPGFLSVFEYSFKIVGVYYGQCSEICGANHAFMPIVVEVTLFNFFKGWLLTL